MKEERRQKVWETVIQAEGTAYAKAQRFEFRLEMIRRGLGGSSRS